jgi:hypothetical protein
MPSLNLNPSAKNILKKVLLNPYDKGLVVWGTLGLFKKTPALKVVLFLKNQRRKKNRDEK